MLTASYDVLCDRMNIITIHVNLLARFRGMMKTVQNGSLFCLTMHCCVDPWQTFNSRTVRDGANGSFLPCACGRVPRGGVRWTVYSATARDRRYNGERCTRMHGCMVALLGGPSISPHAGRHEEPTRVVAPTPFLC
jgi:hypothetical protein